MVGARTPKTGRPTKNLSPLRLRVHHARATEPLSAARNISRRLGNYKLARQYKGEAWIVHGNNDTVVNVKRCFAKQQLACIMDNFSHNGLWPYLFQNTSLVNVFK